MAVVRGLIEAGRFGLFQQYGVGVELIDADAATSTVRGWPGSPRTPRRHFAGRVRHPESVADDLRVNSWLVIPAGELRERFSRSSGPGGQSVNTADTRVELSYDVTQSAVLPGYARERILDRLGHRMADGVLTVVASEQRSQLQNRRAARGRMANLLREALAPPQPPRIPTRPGRGARERRVADKRRRGAVKRSRRLDSGDTD